MRRILLHRESEREREREREGGREREREGRERERERERGGGRGGESEGVWQQARVYQRFNQNSQTHYDRNFREKSQDLELE